MRLRYSDEDEAFRAELLAWLEEHPPPTPEERVGRRSSADMQEWAKRWQRTLFDGGWLVPGFPPAWGGRNATAVQQMIYFEVFSDQDIPRSVNPQGLSIVAASLLDHGTEAQIERWALPTLRGELAWCLGMSEPGAGSDLAGLSTRAVLDGDEFVVNGQKIWTSGAQYAKYGILIARTDPDLPKHKGVSYFVCPMDLPGIEIRPITEMTGGHTFNEVFFTDVRIPAENLVGDLNDGWRLAKVTLGNERVSLSTGGVLWGNGPTAVELIDSIRDMGPVTDPHMRQRIAGVYIEHMLLDLIRMRTLTATLKGQQPGPEASIRKLLADEHGQHVMSLARDYIGAAGMLAGGDGETFVPGTDTKSLGPEKPDGGLMHAGWYDGFMFSQALTIGGGTFAVQRNIIGEWVLGLPREPDVSKGLSWAEAQRVVGRS